MEQICANTQFFCLILFHKKLDMLYPKMTIIVSHFSYQIHTEKKIRCSTLSGHDCNTLQISANKSQIAEA